MYKQVTLDYTKLHIAPMFVYAVYACATLYINSQDSVFIAQSVFFNYSGLSINKQVSLDYTDFHIAPMCVYAVYACATLYTNS
ncbi:hypothetical protein TSAR_015412 [Trichomalopsis sarcophagae]|uniref:Uncharacterized protein n=1 Tax=Trichomalopsis sarcophagae TaxID=543379 RepID=A0A232FD14_9HYME|nr:hypothetical protein TSAR_015412 [Trichomalopsis sarcophagae]